MLSIDDVYSFYGLSCVDAPTLDDEARKIYSFHLKHIQSQYIKTLRKRIVEEAGYIGLDVNGDSIASLVKKVTDGLQEQLKKQSAKMTAIGVGFNIMDMIKSEHSKKPKSLENAADAFRSKDGKSRSMFGGDPWAKISEAFMKIEEAATSKEIIFAIDQLNDLQHNTCAVIFDLTGTRGSAGDNHAAVQAVLDEKFKAKSPQEFADKMSSDVREFLKEQRVI
jgi:hypothetical protein